MSTTIKTKSSASIRIDTDLLNILKSNAKRDNRSLSNYLETILFRILSKSVSILIEAEDFVFIVVLILLTF